MRATAEAHAATWSPQARAWNALALVQQLQGDHHAELESEERAEAAARAAIALTVGASPRASNWLTAL